MQTSESAHTKIARITSGDMCTRSTLCLLRCHGSDVIINTTAFQITRIPIVYSTVCPSAYQRKHPSSVSLAFVRGIHRWPVNSPHKGPVTRNMLPFGDVIMWSSPGISFTEASSSIIQTRWQIRFTVFPCLATISLQKFTELSWNVQELLAIGSLEFRW